MRKPKCACGETNPQKFYGHKKTVCGQCHNQYTIKKGKENRLYALAILGGKCIKCGFDKHSCALDIHHKSDRKDENFASMRGWSKTRIESEIKDCEILCKNCHSIHHFGI